MKNNTKVFLQLRLYERFRCDNFICWKMVIKFKPKLSFEHFCLEKKCVGGGGGGDRFVTISGFSEDSTSTFIFVILFYPAEKNKGIMRYIFMIRNKTCKQTFFYALVIKTGCQSKPVENHHSEARSGIFNSPLFFL